jgi:cytochrome c-type biogenesis protein CcmH/NrfG
MCSPELVLVVLVVPPVWLVLAGLVVLLVLPVVLQAQQEGYSLLSRQKLPLQRQKYWQHRRRLPPRLQQLINLLRTRSSQCKRTVLVAEK